MNPLATIGYETDTQGGMIDRLKAAGVEASLFSIEGAGHGFKGEEVGRADAAMFEFFERHLKPAGK